MFKCLDDFMSFELSKQIGARRVGKLHTKNGVINTPFFMPIATKGAVKNLSPEDLKKLGAEIVLGNTYHLWLRPGDELIARAGGLHQFMHWDRPILTDSGGYQVFSLGARAKEKYGTSGVKISEEGVSFTDPIDGKKYFMSPEKSIEIQLNLGSDMIMVLDECPPFPCSHEQARQSMELTLRWAKRCKEYYNKKQETRNNNQKIQNSKFKIQNLINRPLLFGIVQGSIYEDLRRECTQRLMEIGFDGYAIGGVAVGEPRQHLYEILDWVAPLLPADKPRYLMGLGRPEELVRAVEAGMDMFDCVIPTREGRHGRLFIWNKQTEFEILNFKFEINKQNSKQNSNFQKNFDDRLLMTNDLGSAFYETLNITNEKFKEDFTPIESDCQCETCQNFTRAYLHHLLKTSEPLYLKLASVHNLHFYLTLMNLLGKK
jgi:queuine tRNA-ribosyltransferase